MDANHHRDFGSLTGGKVLQLIGRRGARSLLPLLLLLVTLFLPPSFLPNLVEKAQAAPSVPYGIGNYTYVNKPLLPQRITNSSRWIFNGSVPVLEYPYIQVGYNWTFIYSLEMNKLYHVYCFGDWVQTNSTNPQTDYDIYVFDPDHLLVSYHTESAGLPEHLGTTVKDAYFKAARTGNYSFQIKNDPRESNATDGATFMVIEHIDTNLWYSTYMEGCVNDVAVLNTNMAYEFQTSAPKLKIRIKVPDTLDMYEARLYLMSSSATNGTTLNGALLPQEPFLYGNYSDIYGGYNFYTPGFRFPNRLASCEYAGQYMEINYDTNSTAETLYHLALIAENGTGTLEFLVKTDFNPPTVSLLNPPTNLVPDTETTIQAKAKDNETRISAVILSYTTNNWLTNSSITMNSLSNGVFEGRLPGFPATTAVKYSVKALDLVENSATTGGSCTVKYPTTISCSASSSIIKMGESLTVSGRIDHPDSLLSLTYKVQGGTIVKTVKADATGLFGDTFKPTGTGVWTVQASWSGNATCLAGSSTQVSFTVEPGISSLTIEISPPSVEFEKSVTVNGLLSPSLANRRVTVSFIAPDGAYLEKTATTGSDGSFTVSFTLAKEGQWAAQALFPGDTSYRSSSSSARVFTVSKSIIQILLSPPILYILIGVPAAAVAGFFLYRRYFSGEEEEE